MENFVLNLFSEQLSRVILDFNPNTINANLLSGKGSITNLRLNVDVINDFLNKPPHGTLPFVKFTEIRLSELRVEVTSYTNLKKSPIVLVIEEIHASAVEPMEYHLDPANAQKKAKPPPSHQQQTSNQARQQYGLLHRILDNLSVKINRIHLTFQTLGKFKTQRKGIWTPPPVSVTLENVEWISVSEAGNPGTPEAVWAHNELFVQQNRFRKEGNTSQHRSYIIYKRLSMICHVRLASEAHYEQTGKQKNVKSAALISNTQIDVHVAYIRRLRDAGVSGIDVDVLCHDMDINLDVATLSDANDGGGSNASRSLGCDVGSFVHMMIGLLHCYYKDRSFVDPLLPDGVRNVTKQHVPIAEVQSEKGTVANTGNNKPEDDEEIGPDDFMPEISLMDDVESDSDYEEEPDEEHDEAFLEWKRRYDIQKDGRRDGTTSQTAATDDTNTDAPTTQIEKPPIEESEKDDTGKKEYKRKRKAVIVIASGAQKFEKVSFSLSVSRVNMKLFLPSYSSIGSTNPKTLDRHCIELLVEGLVAEFIWPKVSGEIGGHVQCSFGYVHIFGLLQRLSENQDDGNSSWTAVKLFPLLKIGTRLFQGHDIFSLPQHLKKSWGADKQLDGGLDKCEEFPSMESRKTTWTWDRPRRGKRAFGLKSSISFVDEKLTTWSKTSVNHEACLGTVDIILDSVPIDNMMKVFSNQNSLIDARWLSGDWTAAICNDAIAADNFRMKDYLQPLPAIYQSRRASSSSSSMPSSELRSITAQLGSINIRVPNPGGSISSFGMTDVICGFTEATIIVSSDLPKSFLSGRIMACENNNPSFPNDPTDFSCTLESQQVSSSDESTQFRMQVSVNNFSVDSVPMHQALHRGDSNVKRLIAPTNVTLMACLEQTGAKKQSIIVSVLLQELECNLNLRLLCGALQTLNYHACNIMMKPKGNSQINGVIAAKDNGGDKNVTLSLCFHMPDISVKGWGEDSNLRSKLLFQVEAKQIEIGSESMRGPIENRSVLKIAADSISVDVCSESDMLELLSIGIGKSHVIALGQTAVESCSISNAEVTPTDGGGLSLRVENHDVNGTMPSLSYAIDNKSPLAVSLSFDALEVFLKTVVNALSLPVLEQSTSISIGNSIFSSIHQLCSIFSSSQEVSDAEAYHEERARNTLMRFFLSQIILLVEVSNEKSFLLLFKDVEIASGQYDKITSLTENDAGRDLLVCKHCGGDKQTWLEAYHLIDTDTKEARATFYALKLQNTVMSVAAGNSFDIVMPQNVVDYRSPIPKGGSSKQSLIDIKSLKKMLRHSMKVGKSFSSSYYKLYSMLDATLSSDLSPTATRVQKVIADYHEKMQAAVRHMDAEVHSLRKGIFLKERERIGALALASSTASGWVRVGEDSSFSNARLFTSATFWRYWMVLDKSVIVLYKAPGCTAPSFIIPMHKHTKLRTISMASSSNKNTVVGNHLRQRGFALFDESEGMELFFVTNNQTEYDMFVSSIGRVLNSMQTDSSTKVQKDDDDDDASVIDISNDNSPNDLSSEAGTASQTNPAADVDPSLDEASVPEEASGSNNQLSVSEATASIDFTEDSHMEVTEEMIDIQLDDEVGSTDAGFVNSDPSQSNQTQNTQLLQSEDALTSKASTIASLSMRERLALAKGKSKLATSKFGSTLKNAKQMTREDIKQKGSQKMTVLKQTANTKLSSAAVIGKASLIQATTAVRSSMHEQSIRTTNSSDSMDKNNPSKLEKVNKSMTSAMQRLHIDEKVTKISTAVKSVRSENQVMRQLSSEMASRRKIGIAEEHMNKPVKFDARETFTAISGHPTKVKSIVSGASLAANDQVCTPSELQKFHRSWFVDVSATGSLSGRSEVSINETKDVSTKPHHQMKYKITLTDACNEVNKHSVERSISELLVFHVTISESLAKTSILKDSSSFERLQVAGSLLQRIIDGNSPLQSFSSVTDMNCEWIKIFASTLLESYLPEQVLEATTDFFELKEGGHLATRTFRADGPVLNSDEESCAATTATNEAFDNFARAVSNQNQSVQSYAGMVPSANDRVGSQLLDIIMTAYNEATSERESALATLAISSVLNDHHIMQKQLAKGQSNKTPVGGMRSSDDEMLALCKQLGNEIAAKTEAELEVNRLKEQLELERKIAQAKEAELLEQLSKKK